MKKIALYVVLVCVVWTFTSKAHAWDVYVYNKTKSAHIVAVITSKQLIGEDTDYSQGIAPGANQKVSTYFLSCPSRAYLIISKCKGCSNLPGQYNAPSPGTRCANTRLEVYDGGKEGEYTVEWPTQW